MGSGTVKLRVRPLRVGFLVDPTDSRGLYQAIKLSTCLWGGSYNPIIPAYRHAPTKWDFPVGRHRPSPSEIIDGYLGGFDPDIVVPVGTCSSRAFESGNRKVVKSEELIGDSNKSPSPNYGTGIIEVLNDIIEKEFKYKRNDDLQIVFLNFPRAYRLFLSSVFGVLLEEVERYVKENYLSLAGVSEEQASIANFITLLKPHNIFMRRLGSWTLKEQPFRDEPQLFLCDATSTLDIIDYWNLRAAGYYVVPIPMQVADTDEAKGFARDFIELNHTPYRDNPKMYRYTTIQRSRSLSKELVANFCQSLEIVNDKPQSPKFLQQWWYPRIWDSWARDNAYGENVSFPYSYEREHRVADDEEKLEFHSEDPEFKTFANYTGNPKFVNEFAFQFYGSKEPIAEVFPQGGWQVAGAVGMGGFSDWRISKSGPVFLVRSSREFVFFNLPIAELVMKGWFSEKGWTVTLSGPGRIAKQLLKQLGGTYGVARLAHRGIIQLLGELEKESGLPRQAVIERLKSVIREDVLTADPEWLLEGLLSANALRLGSRIQCPVCTRHNWYELNELDYQLRCRFCLSDFEPPLSSPKSIEWTYRAHGPFASSTAQGAFTVLLTLKFLGRDFDHRVTPLFSFLAEKDGRQLESDLSCFYTPSMSRDNQVFLIHVECKSFNLFESRDINRMEDLAKAFPGSIIIFSTLNSQLQNSEAKMIRAMAVAERRKRLHQRPYSNVIVLTGIELFSHRLVDSWKNKGGIHENLSRLRWELDKLEVLADATQQLYLGLPPWSEWLKSHRKTSKSK